MGYEAALEYLHWALTLVALALAIYLMVSKSDKFRGGRYGLPQSEPVKGMLTSGAGMRMMGTEFSQGYADLGREGLVTGRDQFMGGPEPPVFYDIGDISASHDVVYAEMGEGRGTKWALGERTDHGKRGSDKSGLVTGRRNAFTNRDVVAPLSPY